MAEVINMFDKMDWVGYCGECGHDLFYLVVSSDNPDEAIVTGLRCGNCSEQIDLAPIIVECDIDK